MNVLWPHAELSITTHEQNGRRILRPVGIISLDTCRGQKLMLAINPHVHVAAARIQILNDGG